MENSKQTSEHSIPVKLGYGAGDFASSLFFTVSTFLLLNFLTDEVGLGAALAGLALLVGKIWDAVTDPVVGFLSDRTRTRWGRRRPYLLFAAVPFGLSFLLMFTNPGIDRSQQILIFWWATLAFMLLCTCYTFANIPYNALLPEIARDFDERTSFMGFRTVFSVAGTFLGAGASLPLVMAFSAAGGRSSGFVAMAAIFGGLMAVSAIAPFFAVRERPAQPEGERPKLFRSNIEALSNRPFLLILVPWLLNSMGVAVILTTLIYYFKYIYKNEAMVTPAMIVLLITAVVCIPVTVSFSRKAGKRPTYLAGMFIAAAAVLVFAAVGQALPVYFAFVTMFVAGVGFSTHYVLPWSIVADAVEGDYADTGKRREGVFYGLWTFVVKVGGALAGALCGGVLDLAGYVEPTQTTAAAQPDSALVAIRVLIGPIAGGLFVLGNMVLYFYPIDAERYARIKMRVAEREQSGARSVL